MRVATWNLAGHCSDEHLSLLTSMEADVLLLAEVSDHLALPGYAVHRTAAQMAPRRTWAAVATRGSLSPLADPHPATALATYGEWTLASSILPWRGCGPEPWGDGNHSERTTRVLDQLTPQLAGHRLIWGGDWNHALSGREYAGSHAGRAELLSALARLNLIVPTSHLPHQLEGLVSIDHVGVPAATTVSSASRIDASAGDRRLSDHDAYVVELNG